MIANGCHGKKKFQKMECLPQQAFFFKKNALQISITKKCGFFGHSGPQLMTYVGDKQ